MYFQKENINTYGMSIDFYNLVIWLIHAILQFYLIDLSNLLRISVLHLKYICINVYTFILFLVSYINNIWISLGMY